MVQGLIIVFAKPGQLAALATLGIADGAFGYLAAIVSLETFYSAKRISGDLHDRTLLKLTKLPMARSAIIIPDHQLVQLKVKLIISAGRVNSGGCEAAQCYRNSCTTTDNHNVGARF